MTSPFIYKSFSIVPRRGDSWTGFHVYTIAGRPVRALRTAQRAIAFIDRLLSVEVKIIKEERKKPHAYQKETPNQKTASKESPKANRFPIAEDPSARQGESYSRGYGTL